MTVTQQWPWPRQSRSLDGLFGVILPLYLPRQDFKHTSVGKVRWCIEEANQDQKWRASSIPAQVASTRFFLEILKYLGPTEINNRIPTINVRQNPMAIGCIPGKFASGAAVLHKTAATKTGIE